MARLEMLSPIKEADKPLPPPKSIDSGMARMVGMFAVAMATSDAIPALQKYSTDGLMALSAKTTEINQELTQEWIAIMDGPGKDSDQSKITAEINSSDDPAVKANKVNELTVEFQTHTTLYNQSNAFWNGLNNGINQASSTVSETEKVDLQAYQYGVQAQVDNVTRLLGA
jgi:hypothetical protein